MRSAPAVRAGPSVGEASGVRSGRFSRRRRAARVGGGVFSWWRPLWSVSDDSTVERWERGVRAEAAGIRGRLWCVELLSIGERGRLAEALCEEPRLARALEEGLLLRISGGARAEFVGDLCGELKHSRGLAEAVVGAIARTLNGRDVDEEPLAPVAFPDEFPGQLRADL
jgi:hypothetical protein